MKAKTDKPEETYPLTEKQFTDFAKALVAVPKKEIDKKAAEYERKKLKAKAK